MPGGWAKAVLGANPRQRVLVSAAGLSVAVFLVWSAVRIHGLLSVIYRNSDMASAPVLAEFFGERGAGLVTTGYYPWLEPLYALHLTRWLPDHRVAWEILPFALYGATVALAGWTVWRTVSRAAGIAVALAMAAPAPLVIWFLGAPNMRLFTLAHAVILAAFIVTLPSLERWGVARRAAWVAGLAILLAIGASSDPLVLIGGAAPFAIAVLGGWGLGIVRRVPAVLGLAGVVAGAVGGWLLERLAEHNGIVYDKRTFGLAAVHDMVSNAGLLLQDLALFVHGRLHQAGALGTVLEVIAWCTFIAVPALVLVGALRLRRTLLDGGRSAPQRLLLAYWALAAVAIAISFIASTAVEDISAVRYMTVLWPALISCAVILAPARGPVALLGIATLAAILGCVELAQDRYAAGDPRSPQGPEVSMLRNLVEREHLDHGYAAYWDAAALTDQTDFKARTYPIQVCGRGGARRCQWPFHTIESWYEPKPGVRTYYVTSDTGLPAPIGPPPRRWGKPVKRVRLGHLTVYVYDHDLASVIGPPVG
jgi:hypothetical protein